MQQTKVIIIGAGLGGLTLAQGLKKADIPFHVYERDPTPDFRAQGYRFRLTHYGGEGLAKNLTPELFDFFERTCAETSPGFARINALDGKLLIEEEWLKGQRGPPGGPNVNGEKNFGPYTVDRTTLRNLLLLGLEENVTFGKEFERYEENSQGVTVYFKDGSQDEGGLLVGADGGRSKVRRQYLPENPLVDTDGRIIYGKTPITEEFKERFPKDALKGMNAIVDKRHEVPLTLVYEPIYFTKDVAVESNGKLPSVKDYIYWVLISRKSTFGLEDDKLWKMSAEDVAKFTLKLTEDWEPAFKSILDLQDVSQSAAIRITSALPELPFWVPSARVTLLGDAIHVMSPTGAAGATTALRDAANLCQAIVKEGISVESIGKYEENMRKYAKEAIEGSYVGGKRMFNQPPFEECKRLDI